MRLWSIHPKYLDRQGLVALGREALLAKKVLAGKTRGYRNHPQLIRFKNHKNPLRAINGYLWQVYEEAKKRGYNFDRKKIAIVRLRDKIRVTSGQVELELTHLLMKLKSRDTRRYKEVKLLKQIKVNDIFRVVPGEEQNGKDTDSTVQPRLDWGLLRKGLPKWSQVDKLALGARSSRALILSTATLDRKKHANRSQQPRHQVHPPNCFCLRTKLRLVELLPNLTHEVSTLPN